MDVIESNRMIAEFMGREYHTSPLTEALNYRYDKSWDHLMPVVEKIEAMGYPVSILTDFTSIGWHTLDYVKVTPCEDGKYTKIEAVYTAVTNFIEFKRKGRG